MTMPLMPGAMRNRSVLWRRWNWKSRKNIVLPCFCSPSALYSSLRGLRGISPRRNCT
ncbi:MAG: hypothetical protein RLZZ584_4575 [Pseudomonadota bacterium]